MPLGRWPLLRHRLRDLPNQLFDDSVAEGIEVLRNNDIESGDREIDPCADRSTIGKRTRGLHDSIAKLMCCLFVTDYRPIDHGLL
jgi:hypothetical protein